MMQRYPEIRLQWDIGPIENAMNIVEKTLDELNKVYTQICDSSSDSTPVHTIYKMIEIDLYPRLVTLRNVHFLHLLSNNDLNEPGSPEFPSDIITQKVLYTSQGRWDVFVTLLNCYWKHKPTTCPLLRRWMIKILCLGRCFFLERPLDNSLGLTRLENIVDTIQRTLQNNRIECAPSIALAPRETSGLCSSFLQRFDRNDYAYIIRLDPDSFQHIISSAHNPETRKRVFLTYYRETDESVSVDKLFETEQSYAKQMGHKNSAEMFFSRNFLNANSMTKLYEILSRRIRSALKKKVKVWLRQKQRQCERFGYQFSGELELWDIDYCQNTSKVASYDELSQSLADYFPLGRVISELLSMYEILLGLKASPVSDFPAWHQNVMTFSVRDETPGHELLGYICLDLLNRNGKSDEPTYCYVLQPGLNPLGLENCREIAVVAVVSSFKESFENLMGSNLTLLSHKEVESLCRGIGKAFQGVCSRPAYTFYNTVVMEEDIVGILDKFWDNFAWEPEILRSLSSHYISGNQIPERLLENLQNVRYDRNVFKVAISVYNGIIDLKIRQGLLDVDVTKKSLYNYIFGLKFSKYLDFTVDNTSVLSLPLSRLYYNDLWCQIASDDLFQSMFKINSVLNPKIGLEFRKKILEPFGTVDPFSMLKSFLGRKPKSNAFLKLRHL